MSLPQGLAWQGQGGAVDMVGECLHPVVNNWGKRQLGSGWGPYQEKVSHMSLQSGLGHPGFPSSSPKGHSTPSCQLSRSPLKAPGPLPAGTSDAGALHT